MKSININSEFIVKPDLNEIIHGKKTFKIAPKHIEVLELLIKNAPNPVTREELLESVWKDTIVVEETLTRAISELRKAFGESSKNASIIKTVPKKGYYLDALVSDGVITKRSKKRSLEHIALYLCLFLCLSIIIISFNVLPKKTISNDHILELSSRFENETSPHLSNDNIHLLTVEDSNIVVKNLKNETRKTLTRSGSVIQAEWVENSIIYLSRKQLSTIYISKADGSFQQKLIETDRPIDSFVYSNNTLFIQTKLEHYSQIYSIIENEWRLEYQTKHRILRFRISSGIYSLENDLNTFFICKNGSQIFHSYNEIYDFDVRGTSLLLSKPNQLTRYDFNSDTEKTILENVRVYQIKLNDNDFLTFTKNAPISNLYNNGKEVYSTKRLEFHPVLNEKDNQLAFISTRCGFYNIWLADLANDVVERKTTYKHGYIQNFTWDISNNIIYYLQYIENECFIKSIHIKNTSANLSKKLNKKFDALIFYENALYGKYENTYFKFNVNTFSYAETDSIPYETQLSKSYSVKHVIGKNDIFGIDLKDVL